MQVVLFEPEIPPNTGSVARLCAATLTPLHLIEPLGFKIDDKHLKRAGLDYWPFVDLHVHKDWQQFLDQVKPARLLYFTKKAERSYTSIDYREDDFLVFGPETRGLPAEMWQRPGCVRTAHPHERRRSAQFEFIQRGFHRRFMKVCVSWARA